MDKTLVTDIEKIRKLAKRKREDNYGFRSFLKACEIPAQLIDKIALRLFKEIAAKIDCKKCANCCKEIDIALTPKDIDSCSSQSRERTAFETDRLGRAANNVRRALDLFVVDGRDTLRTPHRLLPV